MIHLFKMENISFDIFWHITDFFELKYHLGISMITIVEFQAKKAMMNSRPIIFSSILKYLIIRHNFIK